MKKLISFSTRAVLLSACMLTLLSKHLLAQLPAYVPANGLVAWYPFNGNANDESGNGNNGVVNGAVLTVDRFGLTNKAYSFDGVNDYITINNSNTISIQTNFSFSVWIYMDGGSCNPRVFEINEQINSCGGYTLFANGTSNQSRSLISTFGSCAGAIAYGWNQQNENFITSLGWHNISVSVDGTNSKLLYYIDGILIQENYASPIPEFSYNGNNLTIGNINPGRCDWWGGKIDDFALYNRALSAEEITALYTSQAEPTCNLGIISTPAATICAGESINLDAEPAATTSGCFTPKVKQAGNQNFGITSTHRDAQGNYYMSGAYSGATTIDGIAVPSIGNRDIFLAKYNSCRQIQWVTR